MRVVTAICVTIIVLLMVPAIGWALWVALCLAALALGSAR